MKRKSLVEMYEKFVEKPLPYDNQQHAAGEVAEKRKERNEEDIKMMEKKGKTIFHQKLSSHSD